MNQNHSQPEPWCVQDHKHNWHGPWCARLHFNHDHNNPLACMYTSTLSVTSEQAAGDVHPSNIFCCTSRIIRRRLRLTSNLPGSDIECFTCFSGPRHGTQYMFIWAWALPPRVVLATCALQRSTFLSPICHHHFSHYISFSQEEDKATNHYQLQKGKHMHMHHRSYKEKTKAYLLQIPVFIQVINFQRSVIASYSYVIYTSLCEVTPCVVGTRS